MDQTILLIFQLILLFFFVSLGIATHSILWVLREWEFINLSEHFAVEESEFLDNFRSIKHNNRWRWFVE